MFNFKELLAEGDLRSDGKANEIVNTVLDQNTLFDELFECISDKNEIIRGHAADALEKICRINNALIKSKIPQFLVLAQKETLAMAKWHYAMIFGYIYKTNDYLNEIIEILIKYLHDESAIVNSWAISSLTIIWL